jgi:cell filamentation protein
MTIGGYDAFDDPYSYRGTDVLKSRLGTRDPEILQAFELEMSALRADEPLPTGRYGPAHYRAIHRHLFQDIYSWAGRYRTARTAKGGNWFCFPEQIDHQMAVLFRKLDSAHFKPGSDFGAFAAATAEFMGDLNAIHPFREGYGRSQLSFLHLVALRAGHPIALARVNPRTFMPAMIVTFDGELVPLVAEITSLRA